MHISAVGRGGATTSSVRRTATDCIAGTSSFAVASLARSMGLFHSTPLLNSAPLSELVGCPVYLKMDALQPSGSFKDRGMAHLFVTLHRTRGAVRFVSSSGGNAGLAAATVGAKLGVEVEVVVPETTKPLVVKRLKSLKATVIVHGANWNAADELARERVGADPFAEYVSPYDHPLLWEGHSSLVDELVDDWGRVVGPEHAPPSHLVASVGGGGLLCGILEGLQRHGNVWTRGVAIVAAETHGAASFGASWAARQRNYAVAKSYHDPPLPNDDSSLWVTLDKIDSLATSLGALRCSRDALDRAERHAAASSFAAVQCSDSEAVDVS
jgi:L-serine/L-threonine ammonia-lyase